MGMEAPEQPRLSCREVQSTTVGGCRHADGRGSEQRDSTSLQALVVETRDKTSKLAASCQIVAVQMGWLHGKMEMNSRQHKQFDPGG